MKPQELSNEDLIEMCQIALLNFESPHLTELITRFERIILGKVADDAIEKLEELQQPTLQVGWEYQNGHGQWEEIVRFHPDADTLHKFESNHGWLYVSNGLKYHFPCILDLDLSTGRPMKKVQVDDEVEALAEKIYVSSHTATPKQSFEIAQEFINHRNERRAGK